MELVLANNNLNKSSFERRFNGKIKSFVLDKIRREQEVPIILLNCPISNISDLYTIQAEKPIQEISNLVNCCLNIGTNPSLVKAQSYIDNSENNNYSEYLSNMSTNLFSNNCPKISFESELLNNLEKLLPIIQFVETKISTVLESAGKDNPIMQIKQRIFRNSELSNTELEMKFIKELIKRLSILKLFSIQNPEGCIIIERYSEYSNLFKLEPDFLRNLLDIRLKYNLPLFYTFN